MFSNAPDSAARGFMYSAVLWLLVGASAFALAQGKLVFPELLSTEILSYSRVRAVASIALIYGWLTQAALAAILYVVPRISGVRMASERAGQLAGMLLNAGLAAGVLVTLLTGVSGREFLELPRWLGALITLALLLVAAVVLRTIYERTEARLYSSAWYMAGAVIWAPLSLAAGALPDLRGERAFIAHLFSLNAYLYLFLGGAAIGTILYLVPRATGSPLYSHRLALIGFWWLAISAPLTGQSRQVFGPGPDWLETLAIAASITLLIPFLALALNIFGTLQGAWREVHDHPSVKFQVAGAMVVGVAVVQGLAGSFRSAAKVVGATDWVTGQVWLVVLGISLVGAGAVTFMLPRLIGRTWLVRSHVTAHLWLTVVSAGLVGLGAIMGGIVAGSIATAGAVSGVLVASGETFEVVLEAVRPYRALVLAGSLLFLAAQWVFGFNVLRTTARGEPHPIELVVPPEERE